MKMGNDDTQAAKFITRLTHRDERIGLTENAGHELQDMKLQDMNCRT